MEDKLKKTLSIIKNIHLSQKEKDEIRKNIIVKIGKQGADVSSASIPTPYYFPWVKIFSSQRLRLTLAIVLLVVSLGSTLVFASEGASPGDFLYPVKVHVSQPIINAFAPSTSKKKLVKSIIKKAIDESGTTSEAGTKSDAKVSDDKQPNSKVRSVEIRKQIEQNNKKPDIQKDIQKGTQKIESKKDEVKNISKNENIKKQVTGAVIDSVVSPVSPKQGNEQGNDHANDHANENKVDHTNNGKGNKK